MEMMKVLLGAAVALEMMEPLRCQPMVAINRLADLSTAFCSLHTCVGKRREKTTASGRILG